MTERHIVMFSGGIGSWGAARRVVERVGRAAVTLLFTDTRMEDDDLYRFLDEAAADVGAPLVKIADGRTPWEVFHDEKLLGDSRFDPCSKILKRRMSERWLKAHCDPAETTLYLGIDWTEEHRFDDGAGRGARYRYARLGWRCEAPMLEPPYLTKTAMLDWLKRQGIRPPRLYELGFAHNNCFAGETEFMTDRGIRRLDAAVGETVNVLGVGGRWTPADIQSFGVQPLLRLSLRRYGVARDIYATAGHRWFIRHGRTGRDERLTTDLRAGDRLASIYGQIGASVRPSPFGIAQGIVFGDGTCAAMTNGPATVVLCGEKDRELLKWFPNCTTAEWEVVSVEWSDRTEEVFCAVVPEGHAFALEGNILTGNCGGFCIKAGHGHFAHLLRTLPERYAYHEAKETEFRETRGWRHAILRDRRGGQSKPLPLRALRERIEGGEKPDRFDIGGCGCFLDDEPDAA